MNTLQETLDAIHADFESKAPAAALEIMHRATDDLIATSQHERALSIGSTFPDFDLTDTENNAIRSEEIIGKGPVIINFFRGFW